MPLEGSIRNSNHERNSTKDLVLVSFGRFLGKIVGGHKKSRGGQVIRS